MINKKLNLNQKLFEKDVELVPIRKGFGEGLLILVGMILMNT
jgi:hypothetical protein